MSIKARLDRIRGNDPDIGNLRLRIELVGPHAIFRFAVNMLDQQCEFARAGELKLRALRQQMGRERFDPMAKQMLGLDRYNRYCHAWGGRPVIVGVETLRTTGGAT